MAAVRQASLTVVGVARAQVTAKRTTLLADQQEFRYSEMVEQMKDVALQTPRLLLRAVDSADTKALHDLFVNPEVRRYLWDDEIVPFEVTESIVKKSCKLFETRGFGMWGIRLTNSATLIGFTGFWYFRDPPVLELLFGLDPAHWNQGLTSEAAAAVVDYGFGPLGFARIEASTDAPNTASVRVLEKLGYSRDAIKTVDGLETVFFSKIS